MCSVITLLPPYTPSGVNLFSLFSKLPRTVADCYLIGEAILADRSGIGASHDSLPAELKLAVGAVSLEMKAEWRGSHSIIACHQHLGDSLSMCVMAGE